jgi:hypothetical protein
MMETFLQVIGTFLIIDLIAAFGLAILVWLSYRRSSTATASASAKVLAGLLVFLGIASALIYGGLWVILRAGAR